MAYEVIHSIGRYKRGDQEIYHIEPLDKSVRWGEVRPVTNQHPISDQLV